VNGWGFLAIAVGALATILGGWSALAGHRVQRDAVSTDRFDTIIKAQDRRIEDLERGMKELKIELSAEKGSHEATRHLLGVALRHIRAVVVWSTGPRTIPLPDPPSELMDQL
jgi:hypothetical protein